MCKRRNILSAIKPLTVLSNWIYFNSYTIRDDKIVVSRFKMVASTVFAVFCFVVKCLTIALKDHPGFEQLFVNLTTSFMITFCLASFLNCLINGRSIARIFNEIIALEGFIREKAFCRKAFKWTCLQLGGFNALFLFYISMYYYSYPEDFQSFLHCLDCFADYCILIHFCGTGAFFYDSLYLGARLVSAANKELRKLKRIEYYNDCRRWKGLDFIKMEKVKKLRSEMKMIIGDDVLPLMDSYEKLCQCFEELNERFGVSLTVACMNNMTQMTLCCYFMTKHGWVGVRLFSVWLSYCFLFEWNLLQACENFMKQAEKTSHIIDLVVTDSSSKVLKDGVQKFSQHLLHRQMKFTACRFFDLNYKLLCSLVTNIITYLVIVVQFDSSRNSDTI